MDIGTEEQTTIVEPLEDPVPAHETAPAEPIEVPEPERETVPANLLIGQHAHPLSKLHGVSQPAIAAGVGVSPQTAANTPQDRQQSGECQSGAPNTTRRNWRVPPPARHFYSIAAFLAEHGGISPIVHELVTDAQRAGDRLAREAP